MNPSIRRAVQSIVTLLVAGSFTLASAQEKVHREMNGHVFLPSHLMMDPFSYTAFGTTFGVATGNALGPTVQLDPPAILAETKWYGYTGLGLGIVLNVRILEYLSLYGDLGAMAYLGTGSGSALVIGTSARLVGSIGAKGSLPLGDAWRLAANVTMRYGPAYSILLAQGLIDAIRSGQIDGSQFLAEDDNFTWTVGGSAAWAPTAWLGVTGNVSFLSPTRTGKASYSQNGVALAGMVDFDALPLVKWLPLGANLAYSIEMGVGGNGVPTNQEFGFGFYYTGRKDLALGLEIDWQFARLPTQQVSESTLAWVNLRYYWN